MSLLSVTLPTQPIPLLNRWDKGWENLLPIMFPLFLWNKPKLQKKKNSSQKSNKRLTIFLRIKKGVAKETGFQIPAAQQSPNRCESTLFNREVLEEKPLWGTSYYWRGYIYLGTAERMNLFLPFTSAGRPVGSGFQMSYNGLSVNHYIHQSCLFKAFFTLDMLKVNKKVVNTQVTFPILAT